MRNYPKFSTMAFVLLGASMVQAGVADRLTVRQSILDKNKVSNPANIQFVSPDDGEDSYVVDAGIKFDIVPSSLRSSLEAGPSIEYHRNTATDMEQDTLLAGFDGLWLLGDALEQDLVSRLKGSLAFKDDEVATTEGFQAAGYWLPESRKYGLGLTATGPDQLAFLWQPSIGTEFESIQEARDPSAEGDVIRFRADLDLAIYPFFKALDGGRLELLASLSYWAEAEESGRFRCGEDDFDLIKLGLVYWIDEERHFGVGLDRVKGDDPTKNQFDQDFFAASLKITFGS